MIKAVFFDIDGTLVSFNTHRVPDSAREAITTLRQKGIKVFIATGRHLAAINNLPGLEFDGYVTLNGGLCYAGHNQIIYKHAIPREDIQNLLDYMDTHPMPCVFVREGDMHLNFVDRTVMQVFDMLDFIEVPCTNLREVAREDVLQLIAFFNEGHEEEVMERLPHCRATRWHPSFSDVVPQGGSKVTGILKTAEHFGFLPEEVMAFGDGGNDLEMLRFASPGIAMGNAEDHVKAAADYVTSSVDEDGIAHALQHYGLI